MVTVSVLYPKTAESHFDHVYYMTKHLPMVQARWSSMGLVSTTLLRGTSSLEGGPAAFELIGVVAFESAEHVQAALATHGAEIIADIPNFTNVTPVMQMNEPASLG